jgi:hypothetical protein
MAEALKRRRGLGDDWTACFNAAFARYRERAFALQQRAEATWFPPRRQNVCLVTDLEQTRPYYQPFNKNSWLLYASDFDPQRSSVELACYLFFHVERHFLTGSVAAAVVHNLSYWLTLDDDALVDFRAGAARCSRPDADAFRALAAALEWIPRLFHKQLRPPDGSSDEPTGVLEGADLVVPVSLQEELRALAKVFGNAGRRVVDEYFAGCHDQGGHDQALAALCRWLRDEAPALLVTGNERSILWDPQRSGETDDVAEALAAAGTRVVGSIHSDLQVVAARSQDFLARLKQPEALPLPGEEIEEGGLSYIHPTRKLIAYDLHEADMFRLLEAAAPYERLMLGARTIHEWGHLAVDADIVPLAPDKAAEHDAIYRQLRDQFERLLDAPPAGFRELAAEERRLLGGRDAADGLAQRQLQRLPDFQANVLARELLSPAELETYVRNQVNTLAQEDVGPYAQLARYAYEYQYLSLSLVDDPFDYFLGSTWFREHFVDAGIISEAATRELFDTVGRLFACYQVDHGQLSDA